MARCGGNTAGARLTSDLGNEETNSAEVRSTWDVLHPGNQDVFSRCLQAERSKMLICVPTRSL